MACELSVKVKSKSKDPKTLVPGHFLYRKQSGTVCKRDGNPGIQTRSAVNADLSKILEGLQGLVV